MRDEKEERKKEASKVKQTNKAKQHSTPMRYMYIWPSVQGWASRCPLLYVSLSGLWLGGLPYHSFSKS